MRWAINSRNQSILDVFKRKGSEGLRNMRICSRHFFLQMKCTTMQAEFFEFFNNLFDIFNSKGENINEFKCGITSNGKLMKFLVEAIDTLDSICYSGRKYTNSLPCLLGWRMNVKFIISLFNHLKSKYNINKLTTHNCTQDDVENFFSRMRSGGGNRFNPAAHEFLSEYRKITVDSLFVYILIICLHFYICQ